ncbi:dephospho-CoA kinase [Pseudothermotoga sp.]
MQPTSAITWQRREALLKLVVGLTGRTGSGKSTVANMLKQFGASVIDVDKIGHEVLQDESVKEELRQLFGSEIFSGDEIDRVKLGRIVFDDEEKLKALEKIVHPLIRERVSKRLESMSGVVVLDAAILKRIGLDKLCDAIITVKCDDEKIIERLRAKGLTEVEIKKRLFAQRDISEEGFIVENDSDIESLREKVIHIYKQLLKGGVGS